MTIETILKIILLFFVLVSIHEWGHFYFAKRAGILVREFAIGFGPKLFSYRRGETRYTLRLLPIGGFVRMAGEDPEVIQLQPGQTVALKLDKDKVTHIFTDQIEMRSGAIIGTVEHADLERQLNVRLVVDGEPTKLAVHPQAMMVSKGREVQIAPLDRQFGSKTVGQRALAIVMGPVMNFLLAVVLFVVLVIISGIPINVKLDGVSKDSAAEKAGLKAGDIILSVDNQPIGDSTVKLRDMIVDSKGKTLVWVVQRDGQEKRIEVTPELKKLDNGQEVPQAGVLLGSDKRSASAGEIAKNSWTYLSESTVGILDGFRKMVMGQFKLDDLGGPVKIVQVTGEMASQGTPSYLFWAALFSLYLGLFNLLPFPALDGSRLVFLGIEAIRGKPIDPNRESMVHFIGFAMLMLLMVAVTYNDILSLIKG
ncbi:RIP metalloprotease RseP [Paenibacillus chartarius]|uniref:Zinc metalloprotease n=1 Tax=Paenibacillus chartarius TaxID=747481 RepID=A0ABV6DNZ9_9BACL